jgi:hypothetical protein
VTVLVLIQIHTSLGIDGTATLSARWQRAHEHLLHLF